jgi:hypothetical protein
MELEFDPEPDRMLQRRLRANRLAKEQAKTLKTETMGDGQPRITTGDYCKITDNDQISLRFQNEYNMSHNMNEKIAGVIKVDKERAYKIEIVLLLRPLA